MRDSPTKNTNTIIILNLCIPLVIKIITIVIVEVNSKITTTKSDLFHFHILNIINLVNNKYKNLICIAILF